MYHSPSDMTKDDEIIYNTHYNTCAFKVDNHTVCRTIDELTTFMDDADWINAQFLYRN